MSFKTWLKKISFSKRKYFLSLFFMVLPVILLVGISINFFNLYYDSFENFHEQYVDSDFEVRVTSNFTNFKELNSDLSEKLQDTPYRGYIAEIPDVTARNLTINPPNRKTPEFYNQSVQLSVLNFSGSDIKNFFFNKTIRLTKGRLPKDKNETLVHSNIQKLLNLSYGNKVSLRLTDGTSQNATITGFYKPLNKSQYTKYSINTDFIFFFNDFQINTTFPNASFIDYHLYLHHDQMDILNFNLYLSEIADIESKIQKIFSNYTLAQVEITSSAQYFQSGNSIFYQYQGQIYEDLIYLLAPLLVIFIIFSYLYSEFSMKVEEDSWRILHMFKSLSYIKRQLFLEVLLNNLLAFGLALPLGIGLNILIRIAFIQPTGSIFEIHMPLYFLLFSSFINLFYLTIIYVFSLRKIPREMEFNKNQNRNSTQSKSKNSIRRLIKTGLLFLVILPLVIILIYYGEFSFYNPIIGALSTQLENLFSLIQSFYVIILLIAILFITPGLIIKFFPFLTKIVLRKIDVKKVKLLKQFFIQNKRLVIIFIAIISIGSSFINFYHFERINQSKQKELETYLKVGSDFKLYEPYLEGKIKRYNYSRVFNNSQYCITQSLSGQIQNSSIIFPDVLTTITFNPQHYFSTLNDVSKRIIDKEFLTRIETLKENETLIPYYLNLRYGIKEGDLLTFHPQNTTLYEDTSEVRFVDNYEIKFRVKGFFNFLPGFDQDNHLFDTLHTYSEGGLIITSSKFNYSLSFPNLEVRNTVLMKKISGIDDKTMDALVEKLDFNYISLDKELFLYRNSYISLMTKTISKIFGLFILFFFFLNFLIILRFVKENERTWNLLQLWGFQEVEVKGLIIASLFGIFLVSFILGLVGIIGAFVTLLVNNFKFKHNLYLYPIDFYLDPIGIWFNLTFLCLSILSVYIFIKYIIGVRINYQKIQKYFIDL